MKNTDFYCFAISCVLLGFLFRRYHRDELDPVMRLRLAGGL